MEPFGVDETQVLQQRRGKAGQAQCNEREDEHAHALPCSLDLLETIEHEL